MSLTIITKAPRSRVTVGGEFDRDGRRGFILLNVSPSPAQLTRKTARDVAHALIRFAERVRTMPARRQRCRDRAVVPIPHPMKKK
jgi:hypothetical protein